MVKTLINTPESRELTFKEVSNFVLPFGKYTGEKLKAIPIEYLMWLSDNLAATDYVNIHILRYLEDPKVFVTALHALSRVLDLYEEDSFYRQAQGY